MYQTQTLVTPALLQSALPWSMQRTLAQRAAPFPVLHRNGSAQGVLDLPVIRLHRRRLGPSLPAVAHQALLLCQHQEA